MNNFYNMTIFSQEKAIRIWYECSKSRKPQVHWRYFVDWVKCISSMWVFYLEKNYFDNFITEQLMKLKLKENPFVWPYFFDLTPVHWFLYGKNLHHGRVNNINPKAKLCRSFELNILRFMISRLKNYWQLPSTAPLIADILPPFL